MAEEKKKSWFARHKILTIIIALVAIAIIGGAAGGGDSSNSSTSGNGGSSNKTKEYRFADRADKQDKDVEVVTGESATVDGVKMTVSKVEYKTAMSEYERAGEGKTYVIADVVLENTSNETKPYNTFDFRIQTSGGQVLDGTIATSTTPLNSGDMVAGGKAQGQVVFEVPVEEGHQYIIWKPNAFNASRAIVQVK